MPKANAHLCILNGLDGAQAARLAPDPPSIASFP